MLRNDRRARCAHRDKRARRDTPAVTSVTTTACRGRHPSHWPCQCPPPSRTPFKFRAGRGAPCPSCLPWLHPPWAPTAPPSLPRSDSGSRRSSCSGLASGPGPLLGFVGRGPQARGSCWVVQAAAARGVCSRGAAAGSCRRGPGGLLPRGLAADHYAPRRGRGPARGEPLCVAAVADCAPAALCGLARPAALAS